MDTCAPAGSDKILRNTNKLPKFIKMVLHALDTWYCMILILSHLFLHENLNKDVVL